MLKKVFHILSVFVLLFLPIALLSFLEHTVFHQVIFFLSAIVAVFLAVYLVNSRTEQNRLSREVFLQAYELKKTKEALQTYSITDGQTQVYNERFLNLRVTEECDRAKRYHRPLSYLLVSIDDFASMTKQHGHVLAEVVLQQVAEFLRENTRSVDVIIRYSEERFVIILPETALMQARIVAERIRYAIEKNMFRLEGKTIQVTVSVGYLYFEPDLYRGKEDVFASLEGALQEARKGGPNRISNLAGETG